MNQGILIPLYHNMNVYIYLITTNQIERYGIIFASLKCFCRSVGYSLSHIVSNCEMRGKYWFLLFHKALEGGECPGDLVGKRQEWCMVRTWAAADEAARSLTAFTLWAARRPKAPSCRLGQQQSSPNGSCWTLSTSSWTELVFLLPAMIECPPTLLDTLKWRCANWYEHFKLSLVRMSVPVLVFLPSNKNEGSTFQGINFNSLSLELQNLCDSPTSILIFFMAVSSVVSSKLRFDEPVNAEKKNVF